MINCPLCNKILNNNSSNKNRIIYDCDTADIIPDNYFIDHFNFFADYNDTVSYICFVSKKLNDKIYIDFNKEEYKVESLNCSVSSTEIKFNFNCDIKSINLNEIENTIVDYLLFK